MDSYFDAPPGERVLREFTIRRDASGHRLVVEEPGSVTCAFYTCDAAERYALRAAGGDQHRVHFAVGDAAAVADRDLVIEHHRREPSLDHRLERFAKYCGAVAAVPAQERKLVAGDDREQPVPVVLDLVQPVLAYWRLGTGRSDLRGHIARDLGRRRRTG